MIQRKRLVSIVAAMASLVALSAQAAETAEPSLKPGDPAPALTVAKWVKGEPVKEFEKGKVYVMEFWATWCGPCVAAMPHVTEMQKKYADKGVIVIGMNVFERDTSLTEPFVAKQGERMGYRVAMDEPDAHDASAGKMAAAWMIAAGRNGIPCSFIVDRESRVAWIGHPMTMEGPLAKVVAGTFDIAAQQKLDQQLEAMQKDLSEAARGKDYEKALQILDQMTALDPATGKMYDTMRLSFTYRKGDYAKGNALASELAGERQGMEALSLAFTMLQAPDAEKIDADLALKLANRASEQLTGERELPSVNMVLARAHAAKKDYAKAAEYQEKFVAALKGPQKTAEEKTLADYKEKAAKS
jgi:thiol-disulfide isomerase/thioredoxin